MGQYIDKSAVVAEIENRIKELQNLYKENEEKLDSIQKTAILLCIDECKVILSLINTLEVKEVDLEQEVEEWVKTGPHTSYPWCTIPDAIRITAEHFFELGLKAKGE